VFDPGAFVVNRIINTQSRPGRWLRPRRLALPWVLWVFGLSTTLLLVAIWGRAVTVDQATITRSTEAALSADLVTDRVWDWVGEGLAATDGVGPVDAERVLDELEGRPQAAAAVDALIDQVVDALVAPPGSEVTVDVSSALAPLVPEVVDELAAQGLEVPAASVEATVDSLDPVALDAGEAVSVGVVAEEANDILTLGVLVSAGMLLLFGSMAVAIAEDRWPTVRGLATRVAFSALSFAVLFRFGGWVLDPDGGRSPLRRGGAIIVASNLHVFVIIGSVAALIAAAIWIVRRPQRERTVPPAASERVSDDTTTRELVSV